MRGDVPINRTDAAAMLHDIDYLDTNPYDADDTAIRRFDYTPAGILGKIGLGIRSKFDLPFTGLPDPQSAAMLRGQIARNPKLLATIKPFQL